MIKKPTRRQLAILAVLFLIALTATARAEGVPREQCFPVEKLPFALRTKAETVLLKMMDSEALYTVVGGVKPMSSGFVSFRIDVGQPDTAPLEEAQTILDALRCGDEITAGLLPFHQVLDGKRAFEAVVFNRRAIRDMTRAYSDFFAPYGITSRTPPMNIAMIVEHDATTARFRGLGYLYGYPRHAVDFFVASANEQGGSDEIVPRDFINLPTFERATGRFVYAVPKGHQGNDADKTLRERTARIFAAYKERRARYVGPGKPGIVALLRDWFDDGSGRCSPENAAF